MRCFASDNYSGCLPEVMQFLQEEVNQGHAVAYGDDPYTKEAQELIRKEFGEDVSSFFVTSGTAANVICLDSYLTKTGSVITADSSHLCQHETGAPHRLLGAKFLTIPNSTGKTTAKDIEETYHQEVKWGRHATKPEMVSITQPTEFGTVYKLSEINAISKICKKLNLKLHMDGCRIFNAAVSLGCSLKDTTFDQGVDILSLGGTKNGLLNAEAIVFKDAELSRQLPYKIKQMLNLQSKHRFLSAQYIPFFKSQLWYQAASNANKIAAELEIHLREHGLADPIYPVESNQIFAKMKKETRENLNVISGFYTFETADRAGNEVVRLVASFDNDRSDIVKFVPS